MGVFQLEERLHYHCAGSVQYISRVDHWLPGLTGKGDLVNHQTTNWFWSPYLQKLAQGKWKCSPLCTLIECNFVFNTLCTHTTCFLFSLVDIWGFEELFLGEKKNPPPFKIVVWLGEGAFFSSLPENLNYARCEDKLAFVYKEFHFTFPGISKASSNLKAGKLRVQKDTLAHKIVFSAIFFEPF